MTYHYNPNEGYVCLNCSRVIENDERGERTSRMLGSERIVEVAHVKCPPRPRTRRVVNSDWITNATFTWSATDSHIYYTYAT